MYIYRPAKKECKRMKANGHLVTQEGLSSKTLIAELGPLVDSGILALEEIDLKALEAAAEKERKEAEEAKAKAEKLAREAEEAQKAAEKEAEEAKEADEKVAEAAPAPTESRTKRRRKARQKPSE